MTNNIEKRTENVFLDLIKDGIYLLLHPIESYRIRNAEKQRINESQDELEGLTQTGKYSK